MAEIEIKKIDIDNQDQKKEASKPIDKIQEEISQKIGLMKGLHGENFDESSFRSSAASFAETNGSISGLSVESFIKKDKEKEELSGGRNSFRLEEKNGKFTAFGKDGTIIKGKDFEELNYKVCEDLKKGALARGEEPWIFFTGSQNDEDRKIFSKNAIKLGVVIASGYSEDPNFWQEMKEEYLKNPEHTKSDWVNMTRHVPDETIGLNQEEKEMRKACFKNLQEKDNRELEQNKASQDKMIGNASDKVIDRNKGERTELTPNDKTQRYSSMKNQIRNLRNGVNMKISGKPTQAPVKQQKLDINTLNNIKSGHAKGD